MTTLQMINRVLYIPSAKLRFVNLVMFIGTVLLAVLFHFVSTPLDAITALLRQSDSPLGLSLFVFLISFSTSMAIIFFGVDRYFLSWRHSFCATLGTTVLVSIVYGVVWSLFEIEQAEQSFVFLQPHRWNVSYTVNNLKAGTLLAIFSSIGLSNRLWLKDDYAYDFIEFQKDAKHWKSLIEKRFTNAFGQA